MGANASAGAGSSGVLVGGPERSVQANPALTHFRRALQQGTHWYVALLEAIALWEEPSERYRGRRLNYLIDGEALDWLLLAGRLCRDVRELLPPTEVDQLLLSGQAPIPLETEAFRDLIGPLKYRCFLNYFYGVTVEEALFFALEEEARRHSVAPNSSFDLNPLFVDLYGSAEPVLIGEFLGKGKPQLTASMDVQQQKSYLYFLFKRRILYCLPARVASDTKRGLAELRRQYAAAGRSVLFPGRPDGTVIDSEDTAFVRAATA
ncbi:MAG TPA: hypothetical protein VGP33_11610 [Chloroflexota bacterium]|jgi:hypothetical protein|nr:hypothetical protein [Chloroflexota bacterium]